MAESISGPPDFIEQIDSTSAEADLAWQGDVAQRFSDAGAQWLRLTRHATHPILLMEGWESKTGEFPPPEFPFEPTE